MCLYAWYPAKVVSLFTASLGSATRNPQLGRGRANRPGPPLATPAARDAAELFARGGKGDVTDILPTIETPTLVIHGRDDRLVTYTAAELMVAPVPNAALYERQRL
jgi:pimeloyl-ACP methyl ester carboxylesterase